MTILTLTLDLNDPVDAQEVTALATLLQQAEDAHDG